jgi:nitroreductase
MDVYQAVASRRAVRAFRADPVPRPVLERVLRAAARSPSGGNLQPWNSYVLTGAALAELKKRVAERVALDDPGDERQFPMYPERLPARYRERQAGAARQRFAALGIRREDHRARRHAVAANWDCFGAPVALFCYLHRDMGQPQWADVGMYLQTMMLLLRAEGLHSCPQLAWSVYRESVAELVAPPRELVLFCGLSIGYADDAVDPPRIDRAPLWETVTFLD